MSDWKPSCSLKILKARAEMLTELRNFFAKRDVMEVETPLLMQAGVTDRYMKFMRVEDVFQEAGFLQTSPEYAMKRLLAAGSGSIFQLCKAFRLEEAGTKHNPEFSLLEWYRVGFDLKQLMEDVFLLLDKVLLNQVRKDYTYQQVFEAFLGIDPFTIELPELKVFSLRQLGDLPADLEFDDFLSLLFEAKIEPLLNQENTIYFIRDYPASQAALARLDPINSSIAERFEVYSNGLELANGFYELSDPSQQYERFLSDNRWRKKNGLEIIEIDKPFISSLAYGLPDCSGVALGVDRLLMLKTKVKTIQQVLAFPLMA